MILFLIWAASIAALFYALRWIYLRLTDPVKDPEPIVFYDFNTKWMERP